MIDCVFCQIAAHKEPAYIVYEDSLCLAFLDKFPQTRGHLQLIPRKHYQYIYDVPEIGEFFTTAKQLIHAIIPMLGADHVTIATFGKQVDHAHLWIVPQYLHEVRLREFNSRTLVSSLSDIAVLIKNALNR